MKYYKVKKECSQKQIWHKGRRKPSGYLVGNELYTEKETEKMFINIAFKDCFDIVEISSKRTFFLFGARFETTLS